MKNMNNPLIMTGYDTVDYALSGLKPGETMVLAGRAGMGKSCVAADMATTIAAEGHHVLYIDLEAGAGYHTIAGDYISKCRELSTRCDTLVYAGVSDFGASVGEIAEIIFAHPDATIVFIDYLQCMAANLSDAERGLRLLFPGKLFIYVAQMPRPVTDPRKKRQKAKELHKYIGFVPDATVIIYREEYYTGVACDEMEMTVYSGTSSIVRNTFPWCVRPFRNIHLEAIMKDNEMETEE